MKNIKIILTLTLILLIECQIQQCSYFEAYLQIQCGALKFNETNGCEFLNGKCNLKPSCSACPVSDENCCNSIILSDTSKKCVMMGTQCTEVTKSCNEYVKGKNKCESLDAGTGKRCVLNNGICSSHYDICEDFIEEVDELKCALNIPKNNLQKCKWVESQCKGVPRECKEFEFVMCMYF